MPVTRRQQHPAKPDDTSASIFDSLLKAVAALIESQQPAKEKIRNTFCYLVDKYTSEYKNKNNNNNNNNNATFASWLVARLDAANKDPVPLLEVAFEDAHRTNGYRVRLSNVSSCFDPHRPDRALWLCYLYFGPEIVTSERGLRQLSKWHEADPHLPLENIHALVDAARKLRLGKLYKPTFQPPYRPRDFDQAMSQSQAHKIKTDPSADDIQTESAFAKNETGAKDKSIHESHPTDKPIPKGHKTTASLERKNDDTLTQILPGTSSSAESSNCSLQQATPSPRNKETSCYTTPESSAMDGLALGSEKSTPMRNSASPQSPSGSPFPPQHQDASETPTKVKRKQVAQLEPMPPLKRLKPYQESGSPDLSLGRQRQSSTEDGLPPGATLTRSAPVAALRSSKRRVSPQWLFDAAHNVSRPGVKLNDVAVHLFLTKACEEATDTHTGLSGSVDSLMLSTLGRGQSPGNIKYWRAFASFSRIMFPDTTTSTGRYFDSLGAAPSRALLRQVTEALHLIQGTLGTNITLKVETCPLQKNDVDCGLHLLANAVSILRPGEYLNQADADGLRLLFAARLLSSADATPPSVLTWSNLSYSPARLRMAMEEHSKKIKSIQHLRIAAAVAPGSITSERRRSSIQVVMWEKMMAEVRAESHVVSRATLLASLFCRHVQEVEHDHEVQVLRQRHDYSSIALAAKMAIEFTDRPPSISLDSTQTIKDALIQQSLGQMGRLADGFVKEHHLQPLVAELRGRPRRNAVIILLRHYAASIYKAALDEYESLFDKAA